MGYAKISSKSPYAPIRYEAKFAFILPEFVKWHKGLNELDSMDVHVVLTWLYAHIERWNLDIIDASVALDLIRYGHYCKSGKITYDISSLLLETLAHTDVDNVPISAIKLPHQMVYLHFGKFSDVYQGVFISEEADGSRGGAYIFDFVYHNFATESLKNGDWDTEYASNSTLYYTTGNEDLATVLKLEKATALSTLDKAIGAISVTEMSIEEKNIMYANRLHSLDQNHKHMALALNSLFYLNAAADDVVDDWGSDAPAANLEKIKREKTAGGKKSLEDGLYSAGYRKVKYLGRRFAQSQQGLTMAEHLGSGRSVATHWRRGHFKQQPYGKNSELRKLIFVAPVLINPEGVQQGRIYTV